MRRTGNGYGANAISHSDIDAWCRRNRVDLRPWEYEALDELEMIRLEFLNRDDDEKVSDQPMTADMFDAMFG